MNWVILFFVLLGITGILLLFYGIKDKTLALTLFGIGALIAPIFYYTDLAFLMPMIPAVVMLILYLKQKNSDTA